MSLSVNFDFLSKKANSAESTIEDKNELYGQVFSLEQWHFISRGEFPDVNPYIASNPDIAEGQPLVRAFTDADRLYRFAKENNLLAEDGKALFLSIPTKDVVEYLEQFIPYKVYGIWFNSDTKSNGFFTPLQQLRPIKEHLKNNGWLL